MCATIYTRNRHWFYPEPDESSPHLLYCVFKLILILVTYLQLGLLSGTFLDVSHPNVLCNFHIALECYKPPSFSFLPLDHCNSIR
jgi:hypothetical protein